MSFSKAISNGLTQAQAVNTVLTTTDVNDLQTSFEILHQPTERLLV